MEQRADALRKSRFVIAAGKLQRLAPRRFVIAEGKLQRLAPHRFVIAAGKPQRPNGSPYVTHPPDVAVCLRQ